jgi:Fe-S-cluster containining protein
MSQFRSCGDCTACCSWLVGDAFGWEFGCGKSCKFLEEGKCGVHKARPETCRNYQCAWSQYLLPEEMRPDKCSVLVSVEQNQGVQILKAIPINSKQISDEVRKYLQKWSSKMNTSVIFVE